MDPDFIKNLLYRGESDWLDFKVDQYSFSGPHDTDLDRGELLKDILAFANAWRESDAYILIGVEAGKDGQPAVPMGISKQHLSDHELQQFVNSKTQKPIKFSYEAVTIDGKSCAVIRIPQQERPFYVLKDFGKVKAKEVYIRRGSATATASPSEVAEMGSKISPIARPVFEAFAEPRIGMSGLLPAIFLNAWLSNHGRSTAEQILIMFEEEPSRNTSLNSQLWEEKPAAFKGSGMSQLAKHPLHPEELIHIYSWILGEGVFENTKPFTVTPMTEYRGGDAAVRMRIFARDQQPVRMSVRYSKAEIEGFKRKQFEPVTGS